MIKRIQSSKFIRSISLKIWLFADHIARIGCILRGTHITSKNDDSGHCAQCGLQYNFWRLPEDKEWKNI